MEDNILNSYFILCPMKLQQNLKHQCNFGGLHLKPRTSIYFDFELFMRNCFTYSLHHMNKEFFEMSWSMF